MPDLVDRDFGCFYPATKVVGGAYAYTMDYLESIVGRKFDVFSTFLDLSADYPGKTPAPSTRKQHSEVGQAMAEGHDILVALGTAYTYVQASDLGYYPVYATGADIRAGTFDTQLAGLFNYLLGQAELYDRIITVRFMWEANLGPNVSPYYPGTGAHAVGVDAAHTVKPTTSSLLTSSGLSINTDAADYKATWAYVTAFLRGLTHGSRIRMFYCPGSNDGTAATTAGNTILGMLPPDSQVDNVGYDTYNSLGATWQTPEETLAGPRPSQGSVTTAYDILTAASTRDVWIGEINCMDQNDAKDTAHVAVGHSKPAWYEELFSLDSTVLPRLTTICFFDQPGTRNTWPFDSSALALTAFQAGFNFGPDQIQHGVVADPYVPGDSVPPVNTTGLELPLDETHIAGDEGHTAHIDALTHWVNQFAATDPSGWARLKANTDGTIAAFTLKRKAFGTSYVPLIEVAAPGGTLHDILSAKLGDDTHVIFAVREDGRLAWGPGSTGDADAKLTRTGTAQMQLEGSLDVTGSVSPNHLVYPNVTAPAAPAASSGVKVYSANDQLVIRNQGGVWPLPPSQTAKFGTVITPYPPECANSTSSALTSGVLYLVRLIVPDARTLSRVGFNIVGAATSPVTGQCWAGIFNSSGTLIALTGDQSTVWNSSGAKNMTLADVAAGSRAVEPGYVWAVVLSNATTGPTISRSSGLGTWLQSGGSSTNYGKYGTGLTTIPTSITVASITVDTDNKFASAS